MAEAMMFSQVGAAVSDEKDVTARYLLPELPETVTEDGIVNYFSVMGQIEEVNIKTLNGGRRMGSVKFANPTMELRNLMLNESHEVEGSPVKVITWKMQKLQKPGYAAKLAEEKAMKGKGKGPGAGNFGKGKGGSAYSSMVGGGGWGGADDWSSWGGSSYGGSSYGGSSYGPSWGSKGSGKASDWGPYGAMSTLGKMGPAAFKGLLESWWNSWGGAGGGSYGGKGGKGAMGGGKGKTGKKGEDELDITARYLLSDLPADCTQDALYAYFGMYGEIEEVTCKALTNGTGIVGSVKFKTPTMELRRQMLKETHSIGGQVVKVETWKMKKLARPAAAANGQAGPAMGLTMGLA